MMNHDAEFQKNEREEYKVSHFQAGFILVTCFALYTINYMDRQVFSVVLEPMRIELGFTDSQVGIMQSVFFFCMAIFSIPVSFLLDRWSRKKSLAIMAALWSGATLMTSLGKGFWGILFPRIGVGIGEAAFACGGTAMISASFSQQLRSRVVGIFSMAAPLGAALGTVLGGYISVHYGGWRTPFIVFAIPGFILAIAALFLKDYKTVKEINEKGQTKGFFTSAFGFLKYHHYDGCISVTGCSRS